MHLTKNSLKIFERKTCRVSNQKLCEIFDLGQMPLSYFPLPEEPDPENHPLKLAFNKESELVQLCHTVDPDEMYTQYWYMSGINQSMKDALKSIVDQAVQRVKNLKKGDIVLDIGCNDGTLLGAYPEFLFKVGMDPATNIKPQNCNLHINTYFSKEAFQKDLGEKKAKIVTSIAMFYDLEDPVQFVKDVEAIMSPEGLWIIELSYLPTMLQNNAFDAICAEHLEYYSLAALEKIFSKTNLRVEDVELNDVNGGSIRVYIRHASAQFRETQAVIAMRLKEKELKLTEMKTYIDFRKRVENNKFEMLEFLKRQKSLGKKVIGYGASTKGNTIMAYYGIGPDLVPYVADRNPIKWGRQTVTRIPIISEDEARLMKPDYFLAFPYHFMHEFLVREREFLATGGQFVSPVPSLTIYS
jgi:NDP-4-keto-2,6-dideoxyhexose 3-C-methyltransferase